MCTNQSQVLLKFKVPNAYTVSVLLSVRVQGIDNQVKWLYVIALILTATGETFQIMLWPSEYKCLHL